MKDLLKKKFENALTYEQYSEMLGDNKAMHEHYSKRVDAVIHRDKLLDRVRDVKILVITETWCVDSLVVVPTLLNLVEDIDSVEVRFVLRDQNMDLMQQYLTNGGAAIPKIIVMDGEFNELFTWGPRPKAARDIFEDHRQAIKDGLIEKIEVTKKIRAFYAKNRGRAILDELTTLLLTSS